MFGKSRVIGGVVQTRKKARLTAKHVQSFIELNPASADRQTRLLLEPRPGFSWPYAPEVLLIPVWVAHVKVQRLSHLQPGDLEDLTGIRRVKLRHYVQWALLATS